MYSNMLLRGVARIFTRKGAQLEGGVRIVHGHRHQLDIKSWGGGEEGGTELRYTSNRWAYSFEKFVLNNI